MPDVIDEQTAQRLETAAIAGNWESIETEFEMIRSDLAIVETALRGFESVRAPSRQACNVRNQTRFVVYRHQMSGRHGCVLKS